MSPVLTWNLVVLRFRLTGNGGGGGVYARLVPPHEGGERVYAPAAAIVVCVSPASIAVGIAVSFQQKLS